jgi:hypothetical protein
MYFTYVPYLCTLLMYLTYVSYLCTLLMYLTCSREEKIHYPTCGREREVSLYRLYLISLINNNININTSRKIHLII